MPAGISLRIGLLADCLVMKSGSLINNTNKNHKLTIRMKASFTVINQARSKLYLLAFNCLVCWPG